MTDEQRQIEEDLVAEEIERQRYWSNAIRDKSVIVRNDYKND